MKRIYFLGQSCRLPGASDVSELRRVLHEGRCTVSMIPTDRWNHELFLHPDVGMQGKTYTLAAGVLDDIWGFDLSVFALSPREAVLMDPQQRLLLQTVWEALEDAGIDPAAIAGQRVGVYVGASSMDHGVILGKDPSLVDAYTMTGNTLSLVANRISHAFDLRGPSFVVDTACSSSLVALDQARLALQQGDIDMAIVAGVNLLLHPGSFAGFSAARMLSPTGLCQSFSDSADGYVRSEGCVAVVLQAATVAPQGARAILIDSETNADGYTLNVALPAEEGQFQLLDRLYRRAGVSPDALDFVEAHGTGTLVGDPIEAHALGRALGQHRQRPLPIGSVKSNLGHLEPVSGLVGVLKTLIAFEDRVLPRTLHVDALNPDIDFDALKLVVARDEMPLRQDGPVLAGVSSFGFGGVNAHCILSAVPEVSTPRSAETDASDRPERIFVTSAFCEGALRDLAHDYAGMMRAPDALAPGGLIDQAWARRGLHPKRLGVLVDDTTQAATALDAYAAGAKDPRIVQVDSCLRDAPVVFAYSGNGGQYSGMSRLALRHDAAYRAAFEAIDSAFGTVVGWSLQDRLASETLGSDLKTCEVAQALLFADQAAQTLAFAARGIVPDAVIGHSGGEVAAAFACGALDLAQAVEVVVSRSRVTAPLAGHGRLAALQTSAEEAEALLVAFDVLTEALSASRKLAIAAINSPRSVTIVGPEPDLVQFSRWVRAEHRQACVLLEIHYPYHSAMQDPFEQELKAALAGLVPKVAHIPYFSSTLGMEIDGRSLDAEYWWANTRRPVQFEAAVKASLAGGYRCYMEIGPQPVLGSYLKDSIGEAMRAASVTHSLSATDPPDTNPIARAHLRAILSGARTTPGTVFHTPDGPKVALPRYPWQNTPLRITDSPEIQRIHGTDADHHPLLGRAIAPGATTWRRDLDDRSMPVLKDHRIGHSAVLPGMAFIEMAYAAACKATGGGPVEITDLDIVAPLALSARSGVEVETRAEPETGRVWVKSRPRLGADAFRLHAQARFLTRTSHARPPETESPASLVAQDAKALWVYTDARHLGLHYGPGFQGLEALRHDGKIIDVVLRPGLGLNAGQAIAGFDPVQADCLLHGLITLATGETYMQEGRGFVPVRLERLQVFAPGVTVRSGQLQIRRRGQHQRTRRASGLNGCAQAGSMSRSWPVTSPRSSRLTQRWMRCGRWRSLGPSITALWCWKTVFWPRLITQCWRASCRSRPSGSTTLIRPRVAMTYRPLLRSQPSPR